MRRLITKAASTLWCGLTLIVLGALLVAVGPVMNLHVSTPTSQVRALKTADLGFEQHRAVPAADSQAGVGEQLTPEDSTVELPGAGDHDSLLVRITVFDALEDLTVFAAGAPALNVVEGASASTTTLLPHEEGRVTLSASASADVRVELLASFESNPDAPGSTVVLDEPVVRADTAEGVAGGALTSEPVEVGLVGQGGVPSTGVRSAWVTGTITADAAGTLRLGSQEISVPAGTTAVTTPVPVAEGAAEVSFDGGSAEFQLHVRGWVPEADQDSEHTVNSPGGFVPAVEADTQQVELPVGQTAAFEHEGPTDASHAAVILSGGDLNGSRGFVTPRASPSMNQRASGALIDDAVGMSPQLALVELDDLDGLLAAHGGGGEVQVLPAGSILAGPSAGDSAAPVVEVTSHSGGETEALDEEGAFTIEGAVTSTSSVERIEVFADGDRVGHAVVDYAGSELTWSFTTSAPESGAYDLTFTVVNGAGESGESTVPLTIELAEADDVVLHPDTAVLESVSVNEITDDYVVFVEEPAFEPGDIIVSEPVEGAPEGFLRHVVSIDHTSDGWHTDTEWAALNDAILQADIDEEQPFTDEESFELGPEGGETVEGAVPASHSLPSFSNPVGSFSNSSVDFELGPCISITSRSGWPDSGSVTEDWSDLSPALFGQRRDSILDDGGAYIGASSEFCVHLKFVLKISVHATWGVPHGAEIDEFESSVRLAMQADMSIGAKASLMEAEHSFGKQAFLRSGPVTFMVGPVPVNINAVGEVEPKIEMSLEGELEFGPTVSMERVLGTRYQAGSGWTPIEQPGDSEFTPPSLEDSVSAEIEAEAKFKMDFPLQITFYGAVGPSFTTSLSAGLKSTAEFSASEQGNLELSSELYGEVEARIGVSFQLPIIRVTVLEEEWSLATFRLTLWEGSTDISLGDSGGDEPEPSESPSPTSTPTAEPTPEPTSEPSSPPEEDDEYDLPGDVVLDVEYVDGSPAQCLIVGDPEQDGPTVCRHMVFGESDYVTHANLDGADFTGSRIEGPLIVAARSRADLILDEISYAAGRLPSEPGTEEHQGPVDTDIAGGTFLRPGDSIASAVNAEIIAAGFISSGWAPPRWTGTFGEVISPYEDPLSWDEECGEPSSLAVPGVEFCNGNLLPVDLRGADFSGAKVDGIISGADFRGADLSGAEFSGDSVGAALFNDADLTDLHIGSDSFGAVSLTGATVEGMNLVAPPSGIGASNFAGLDMGDFDNIPEEGFGATNLDDTTWPEEVPAVHFGGSSLNGADFSGVTFNGELTTNQNQVETPPEDPFEVRGTQSARFPALNFGGTSLHGVNFSGTKVENNEERGSLHFGGSDFGCAHENEFESPNFGGLHALAVNLAGSEGCFDYADFSGVDVEHLHMWGIPDSHGLNFSDATVSGAMGIGYLGYADLSGANIYYFNAGGLNAPGADFSGATITYFMAGGGNLYEANLTALTVTGIFQFGGGQAGGSTMQGANINAEVVDIGGATFSGADMSSMTLPLGRGSTYAWTQAENTTFRVPGGESPASTFARAQLSGATFAPAEGAEDTANLRGATFIDTGLSNVTFDVPAPSANFIGMEEAPYSLSGLDLSRFTAEQVWGMRLINADLDDSQWPEAGPWLYTLRPHQTDLTGLGAGPESLGINITAEEDGTYLVEGWAEEEEELGLVLYDKESEPLYASHWDPEEETLDTEDLHRPGNQLHCTIDEAALMPGPLEADCELRSTTLVAPDEDAADESGWETTLFDPAHMTSGAYRYSLPGYDEERDLLTDTPLVTLHGSGILVDLTLIEAEEVEEVERDEEPPAEENDEDDPGGAGDIETRDEARQVEDADENDGT
ncbi:pentapeptide repeat-containing protein [Nesterenkonia populi]